jgi:Ca-activated chloride channel family protein
VLVVMDASKSMGLPAGDGRSRLAVAKAALRTVVDGLPDGARVGLRLYGHRVSGAGRVAGCRDTELVTPVGALDRGALKAQIDSYRAVGSTPIGRALRAAASDLPARGAASIVLVSDGGDNCAPPNPCTIAGELAAAGTGVSIQAIGFQVGARARRQLQCIARRGRGVYRDAADADDLAVALRALAARATRTYRPVGAPIRGAASEAAAAPIGSGRYVDRIGADDERWYAVTLERGQRLAVAAVVSHACPFSRGLAEMFGTSLELTLFKPGGELPEASVRCREPLRV